jgi:hypothetical protein
VSEVGVNSSDWIGLFDLFCCALSDCNPLNGKHLGLGIFYGHHGQAESQHGNQPRGKESLKKREG